MGGSIVIGRRAVLVPVATNPVFYDSLPDAAKDKVDAIVTKAPADMTIEDISTLAALIHLATHC